MRKTTLLLLVLVVGVAAAPVFAADTFTLDTFEDSFETFAGEFAKSLPMNSTIGLNWSDAYIGQLLSVPPSFGVGVTAGVTTVPGSVFTDLTDDLGVDAGGGVDDLSAAGIPIPGYAFDARVGGIGIPFDVGLKFGTIPNMKVGDVEVEYTNVGFDFRYAILDGGVLPKWSVGAGYNYLSGRISTPLGLGRTEISSVQYAGDTYTLVMEDPDLDFGWQANVIDLKTQVSKSFLVIEPHLGLGASYGLASAQTGLSTDVSVTGGSGSITAQQLGEISGVDIDEDGLVLSTDVTTLAFRVFGGASLNLAVFRLDLGLMYNLSSGALGGTVGARVQL